jgi:hypothetical protein
MRTPQVMAAVRCRTDALKLSDTVSYIVGPYSSTIDDRSQLWRQVDAILD